MGILSWLFGTDKKSKTKKSTGKRSTETKKKYVKQEPKKESNYSYNADKNLMTKCEQKYFTALQNVIKGKYIVQPQVNLASIITKHSETFTRHNELFRNIDFGVFTVDTYTPLLLIEINDQTHNDYARKERDHKVKDICKEANIPLITFWTNYGVDERYIEKRIKEYIDL